MTAEDFTFAGIEEALKNGLVTIVATTSIVGTLLLVILEIALGWNYFKLLLETVERYVVVGVFCYTSPLAFAMGGSKETNSVFRSWCRMVGSQLILWFTPNGNDMVDIGGSIIVHYASFEDRIHATVREMTLLQTMYPDSDSYDNALTFGGFLSAACYHIGDRSNIKTTYQKIIDWCDTHHFALRGDSFERHVLDGYSVSDENQFVTEILLPFADEETVIEAQNW